MIMKYTQMKFQDFSLSIRREFHVQKIEICNSWPSHTMILGTISILFISLDRVFNCLFHYMW